MFIDFVQIVNVKKNMRRNIEHPGHFPARMFKYVGLVA